MGFFDRFTKKQDNTAASIGKMIDDLEKSVKATPNTDFLQGQVDQNKVVFSLDKTRPKSDSLQYKTGRLLDSELRDISQYDAIISLIVNTRANQAMSFGYKSGGKYERGFILKEIKSVQNHAELTPEQKNIEIEHRSRLAHDITSFVERCGTTNEHVVEYAFKGSDSYFKDCSLPEFLAAQALNLLIFGRCATQIFRNKDGVPIMFRPIPVENLHKVVDQEIPSLSDNKDTHEQSKKDLEDYKKLNPGSRPAAYVLRINNDNVAFFTADDIMVTFLRKQALERLDGYPLAPIEQAYYTVSMHFYAQQYLQNAFTKGLASKGIINLKTENGGVLTPEQTEHFRKLFTNYVARNDNSATIPVIAGPIDVQFTELNATAKDLEFVRLYDKVIMILCACFQISPQEIGFGNLDSAGSSLGETSVQDQIVQGEERGLRQLVDVLFGLVDKIVAERYPEAKQIFRFHAIGLGQNTKQADLALYREELQTSGTFGKIWAESERLESFPFGGDVPTSPLFHSSVATYMKMSEIRYYFFKEDGALENPDYDFFVDPIKNQMYQDKKLKLSDMEAKQQSISLEQNHMQQELFTQQAIAQASAPQVTPQVAQDATAEKSVAPASDAAKAAVIQKAKQLLSQRKNISLKDLVDTYERQNHTLSEKE